MEVWKRAAGVATWGWRHGALELWRRAADLVTWSYRGLKAYCRRRDVEVWRSGGQGASCECNDVEVWKAWSPRALESAADLGTWRHGGISSRVPAASCRLEDMRTWWYDAIEIWRRRCRHAGVEVCRLRRCGDPLQACRRGGMELWRRDVGVVPWRAGGMGLWRRTAGV
jgi:hypothetical protein